MTVPKHFTDRISERSRERRREPGPVEQLAHAIDKRAFANDLRMVLREPHGRRFVSALLFDLCGVNRRCFSGNSHGMYRQGAQELVGLEVVETLEDGDAELHALWLQLQRERLDAQREANKEIPNG